MESRAARILIKGGSLLTLAFLYVPLAIVAIYAFNDSVGQAWPIQDYTTKWFGIAFRDATVRDALITSLQVALFATALALILGSAAAFAVHRFDFFGRNTVSFLLVLPIALPGIVTAIALRSAIETLVTTETFGETFRLSFGVLTIMIGHATFCIVVVYNNVLARLRRTPTSLIEASMDLGADGWQTFRYVTFPAIRTAVLAGGLLAFALSFDEIIVTNFLAGSTITLPKFIYNSVRLPRNRPVVNVVAVVVVLLMLIPVYIAQRLAGGADSQVAAAGSRADEGSERYCPRGGPPGCSCGFCALRPRRRISSNCCRAAICWANIAAWIPWNNPSSQPTSWACATRISDSLGTPSSGGTSSWSSSFRSELTEPPSSSTERW
jgi:putative spermidine/putrescine transport system permease protein